MTLPTSSIKALIHEHNLIRILYHRNKNQHHASVWWKDLNSLKRNLTKLIAIISQNSQKKKQIYKDKKILKLARSLKFHIIRDCYRSFNVIIALGQFITLGMVLIGMLAKVHDEINKIQGVDDLPVQKNKLNNNNNFLISQVDDDIGEELKSNILKPFSIDANKKKIVNKDGKKKKKKKKSVIDDIFG